MKLTYLEFFK